MWNISLARIIKEIAIEVREKRAARGDVTCKTNPVTVHTSWSGIKQTMMPWIGMQEFQRQRFPVDN